MPEKLRVSLAAAVELFVPVSTGAGLKSCRNDERVTKFKKIKKKINGGNGENEGKLHTFL